jgi:hypothetical protein
MKKLLFLSLLTLSLFSCESEDSNEQPLPAKVLGEWETYKVEKQELHLEGFNGVQAIHSIKWYDQTSQFSTESTLEFNEDSTFKNFYANVTTGEGTWNIIDDQTFNFTFNDPLRNWSDLENSYTVNFYCDNTMSIQYRITPPAGNHDFQDADWHIIQYYRTPGTLQCDDSIDYKVNE